MSYNIYGEIIMMDTQILDLDFAITVIVIMIIERKSITRTVSMLLTDIRSEQQQKQLIILCQMA